MASTILSRTSKMRGRRGQQVTHCQLASTTDVWREYRLGQDSNSADAFNAAWPWPRLRIPTIWLIGGSSRQRWMGNGRLLPGRTTRNASCHDDNCAGRKRLRNRERKNNANRNHGKSGLGTGKERGRGSGERYWPTKQEKESRPTGLGAGLWLTG